MARADRIPRQLPADVRNFVNRAAELEYLDAALAASENGSLVHVIVGTAGVGKTSLAIRWAHQIKERFPDGQFYINLRGYDPGEPVTPLVALQHFLTGLGIPATAIPSDTEAAAAMYRSELGDRGFLVVLDNAESAKQVKPLLPGNSRSFTLVTSRTRLGGLAVRDSAQHHTVQTLAEDDSVVLLRTVTAAYRPADDVDQLVDLARLCAGLPLALRIAAERAASHPYMPIEELIAELRDQSALWDALSTGDSADADAVHTVFAWSYRALATDAARLFRLLGLFPGAEFGLGLVCALAEVNTRRARQVLDGLVGAHMVTQTAHDRYEFHDLLRAFAAEQARAEETAESSMDALRRILDWYLHTADQAQVWLKPAEDRVPLAGEPPVTFTGYDQAVDWSELEQANIRPVCTAAAEQGFDGRVWQLALVWWNAKPPSAPPNDWLPIGRIGLRAAQRDGARAAEAKLLRCLGFTYVKMTKMTDSLECHTAALGIWQELRDREEEAVTLNATGMVYLRMRRLADAESYFQQAQQAMRSEHWDAVVRANLATVRCEAGNLAEALADVDQVLAYHRERQNKRDIGNLLHLRGTILLDLDRAPEALAAATEAHDLALDLRSLVLEGFWLLTLGNAQQALGQWDSALESYQRSAVLHRRLGERSREALAWQGAGDVYLRLDRRSEAADFFRRAIAVHRELDHPWHEALALDGLATALLPTNPTESRQHWRAAARLLAGYQDPRATQVRDRMLADSSSQ